MEWSKAKTNKLQVNFFSFSFLQKKKKKAETTVKRTRETKQQQKIEDNR